MDSGFQKAIMKLLFLVESRQTAPYRLPVLFFDHRPTILWYLYVNTLLLIYYVYSRLLVKTAMTVQGRLGMSNKPNSETDPGQPMVYQIRLDGQLGPQWTEWSGGLTLTL